MLVNRSDIELIINSYHIDLPSDFDVNLNCKVRDPESILSKSAEYSYSFDLPKTPRNCEVFQYANVISVPNKFVRTYDAELNVDGLQLFKGKLRIAEIGRNSFKCNLVVVKVNTVEEIFGDDTLSQIDWKVPFEGISTINEVNADASTKYWFPLVAYGAFAKSPQSTFNTYNSYTSIYSIDYTNKFYNSTFYPSLNMIEVLKRCFESKGYTLEGTALSNKKLNEIYMSTSLGNEQNPIYNLGNPKFGKVDISTNFKNWYPYARTQRGTTTYSAPTRMGTIVDLEYGYDEWDTGHFNFNQVCVYNLLESMKSSTRVSSQTGTGDITINGETFLYADGDGYITIPSDGLYRIQLTVDAGLVQGNVDVSGHTVSAMNGSDMTVKQYYRSGDSGKTTDVRINSTSGFLKREYKPFEIQLVRNYEDKVELIKGCVSYYHGGNAPVGTGSYSNTYKAVSVYPHEQPFPDEYLNTISINGNQTYDAEEWFMPYYVQDSTYGVKYSATVMYDPIVNSDFICGFSSIGNCASIIKNGYSWYKGDTNTNDMIAFVSGYDKYTINEESTSITDRYNIDWSTYHQNSLPGSTIGFSSEDDGSRLEGQIQCMIYLKKNDRLSLLALTRCYDEVSGGTRSEWGVGTYPISGNCNLVVEAMTTDHSELFLERGGNWMSKTEFDDKLSLGQFLSNETKMSDFVTDVQKAFNLSFQQNGNVVTMDTQKEDEGVGYSIKVDDRVDTSSSSEMEFSMSRIEYPSSLTVKWSVNTNEAGFYDSVPKRDINRDDWEQYGEYGYDKIELDTTGEVSASEEQLKFSYNWYEDFTYHDWKVETLTSRGETYTAITDTSVTETKISIPVIAESSKFIDRGNIEDYMKQDGYSLNLRLWFRDYSPKKESVPTMYGLEGQDKVNLYVPKNNYDGFYLNYKRDEQNILSEFFNVTQSIESNYVEIDCHLSPEEYLNLKNGANVIFNSDVYKICEVKKYSINHKNQCNIKIMKY